MKNPPDENHISAWARETTFDLKASLLEERALAAASPIPERSVKRPMRRGASPSLRFRQMGSKRRVRRESRWGTRRIRWEPCGGGVFPWFEEGRASMGGDTGAGRVWIWGLVVGLGEVALALLLLEVLLLLLPVADLRLLSIPNPKGCELGSV